MQKLTLLVTVWKRRKYLHDFLDRWLEQPEVDEIIIWDNSGELEPELYAYNISNKIKIINSSHNYGTYTRDVLSHLAKNNLVIVSDDDILIEKGFLAEMLKYYKEDYYIGIWGKKFKKSYADADAIRANEIDEPTEADALAGLVCIIDRKYLFPIDHRDLMWTCYDIHLSGIFKEQYPQIKQIVVPNKLWHLTEEEVDEFSLSKHPDAFKQKQALYERYWKR